MARRAKRRGKAGWQRWAAVHADIFRIAVGLTPPQYVRVSQTQRGVVFSAVFTGADGQKIKARTRIALHRRTGEIYAADESLTIELAVPAGGQA